ncbi:NifU family protein [Amycolatopsis sp. NPDC051758]|uniref:NifU family protein n=1 Tax=Amycolatopsis sp. NPDC051758 TaxID=3363935 RepID=UPI0037B2D2C2
MTTPPATSAKARGERLETLLSLLLTGANRRTAEELVRQLTDLYGDGLTRIVALLRENAPALVGSIAADDDVAGLLLLHGLHPLDVDARIGQALDRVRPHVSGAVEYLGSDGAVARVRLGASAGCSSAAVVARELVETAVRDAAPEIGGVEIVPEAVTTLYQIGMGPPPGAAREGRAS